MKKILIVEDEIIVAAQLQEHLNKEGYNLYPIVKTGEEAISSVKSDIPDLLFMDIYLSGGINGIDTMGKIMNFSPVPVIFMSGGEEADIFEGLDIKYSFLYLKKPIQMHVVDDLIKRIFK